MTKAILLVMLVAVGCAETPAHPSQECPQETREGTIIVGTDEIWREDAVAFCERLGGSLASASDLQEILVAYREMSDADVRGWIRETTNIAGRRSRYVVGWNGFVTPTVDTLDRAVAVCVIPITR